MKKLMVLASICAVLVSTTACGGRIYLNGQGPEGGTSTKYTSGDAVISEEIKDVDIDWASGSIDIVATNDDTISIYEECNKELEEREKVQWWVDGSCLRIQFSEPHVNMVGGKEKHLTITVPEDINLDSLTIDNASADITLAPIHVKTLSVDTASGNFTGEVKGLCEQVNLNSASGDMNVIYEQLGTFDANTASGDIICTCDSAESLNADTASGDVYLYLDDRFGFTLEVDTASGKVASTLPMSLQDDRYVHGDGSCKMQVSTASGDVQIEEK